MHHVGHLPRNAAHDQHIMKNTCATSYRNSNLCCGLVHRPPSDTCHSLSHTTDICFNSCRRWKTTRLIFAKTRVQQMEAFISVIYLRNFSSSSHHTLTAIKLISPLMISAEKKKISFLLCCSTMDNSNRGTTSNILKKQTTVVTPLEVMKWRKYFCHDIIRHKFLSRRNSRKLFEAATNIDWSYF